MMKRQTVAAAIGAILWSTGAGADTLSDMTACAGVGSETVRLACYDAAVKSLGSATGKTADIGACAKVSTSAVRLACFDAAMGKDTAAARTAGTAQSAEAAARARGLQARQAELDRREIEAARAAAAAKTRAAQEELNNWEAQLRARETALKARIEAAERDSAAAQASAAAADTVETEPSGQTQDEFGGKYLKNDAEKAEFGSQDDTTADALTAETYGRAAEREQAKEERKDKNRTRDGKLKSITVKITNIWENPYGKVRVKLENGQVWKQIDTGRVRYDKNGENTARIRRALMGSFLMTINDSGRAIRVRRVE